jgi:hypothetical protein
MIRCEPGWYSTNRKGPVPTGWSASRSPAAWACPGSIIATVTRFISTERNGLSMWSVIVCRSWIVVDLTAAIIDFQRDFDVGAVICSTANLTDSASKGFPL